MEMKNKIMEKIKSDYSGWTGGVNKEAIDVVESLIKNYDINIEDYETTEEFIEALEDEGYINEVINNAVPIYNNDLYYWVKDNGHFVMEALQEYGYEIKDIESFERMIMIGYYYKLESFVYGILYNNWIEDYKKELAK